MKLVDIPIRRFLADTPLSRDTYLYLPLNNKNVRISCAGEAIPATMLERILAKGHSHLRVAEESEIDPETFMVHLPPEIVGEPLTQAPVSEPVMEKAEALDVVPVQAFSADATAAEPETTVTSSNSSENSSTSFANTAESPEPESRHRQDPEMEESETRFQGKDEKAESSQKFKAEKEEKDLFVRSFGAEKEELPAVIRLQSNLAENPEEDLRAEQSAERDQALREAKTIILSSNISGQIISLSDQMRTAEPGLRDSLRGQMRSLKKALDQVENGDLSVESSVDPETKDEISAISESLSSASRAEQVAEVAERLAAHSLTRKLAQSALAGSEQEVEGDRELARSATSRDLPTTVSRLAAYLGHSLGYTNVDFLADLACGAIAHFARKEGTTLDEAMLPNYTKRIISPDETSSEDIVADGKDILIFLDAYIEDKECDRSHKDLMKRIFDKIAADFLEKEDGPAPISLRKWSSFVDRGPTMDSHSICTRASAKAVKCARNAVK